MSVSVCRATLRPRVINMKYSKIYIDFVCIALHYVITMDYCVSVNLCVGLSARERLVFFMRAEGQRQAHQSFSDNSGSAEPRFSAEEERAGLEDPLSADGGVFAGQRQLGRL